VLAGEAIRTLEQICTKEVGGVHVVSRKIEFPMLPFPSVEEVEAELVAKRRKDEDATWEERALASLRAGTSPTAILRAVQELGGGS